jgi:hypothetical protein
MIAGLLAVFVSCFLGEAAAAARAHVHALGGNAILAYR